MTGPDGFAEFVARSLDRPAPQDVRRLAAEIAARPGVAAVLFYGARLRSPEASRLADLYVLTDSERAWAGHGPGAVAMRLLPPNVYHLPMPSPPFIPANAGLSDRSGEDPRLRGDGPSNAGTLSGPSGAKVAVMRLEAFHQRMRRDSRDSTLWARFAQPAALLYARDAQARAEVVGAVADGWRTAAWWADQLSEGSDRWAGLFAATYSAELRPEGVGRPGAITAAAPELYAEVDRLLPPEQPGPAEAAAARREWARRRRAGRALNAARLVKAAFTFRGGAAYALDKIERHAGPAAIRPWERRLPWLAAPVVLLRLLRRDGLR